MAAVAAEVAAAAAQPRSTKGESAGLSGATRNADRLGLPLAEHGAERDVVVAAVAGKGGAEKGSKGEGEGSRDGEESTVMAAEEEEGWALRAKGSYSGEGKGCPQQFEMKGLVGDSG